MLCVHVSLKSVPISEYSDAFELFVLEVKVKNIYIRIITGYRPQETWEIDAKRMFFTALEEEILKAALQEKSIIVMGDLNSKLRPDFIKNDPEQITENGKILGGIPNRNTLTVVNGLGEICKGVITRERTTTISVEKSIMDFVIVSNDLVSDILSMMIDDERKHALTKLTKTKSGIQKK